MDQKEMEKWRTGRHTPTKNSREYPPPPPLPRGNSVIAVWMLVSFTINHNQPWMLRCRPKAEVTSGEAREACVPSGMVRKNSFARVTIKTWVKPETVHGKSLAPRVFPIPHPCPDFSESRFPGSSRIPYPVNTSLIPHCILSSPGSRE